jgi:hypothetical protein
MHPNKFHFAPARGIALPVTLMILALMLVGAVYLLKSVHSTGLTTGNLAYDSTLSREADLGLHNAFDWLNATAIGNKALLNGDVPGKGYVATMNVTNLRDENLWNGSATYTDSDGTQIQYVIHRMCKMAGAYNDPTITGQQCVQTAPNTAANGNTVPLGFSMTITAAQYAGTPRLHYTIFARILNGARGATVTNQMIVLIGA